MVFGRSTRKPIIVATALLATSLLFFYSQFDLSRGSTWATSLLSLKKDSLAGLRCRELPGANETVVVLKTGSTELQDKLPIHLASTLKCYPNHLLFSDYAERYHGETVIDALEDVDAVFKAQHENFALYRQLQKSGRSSLKPSELSGPLSRPQTDKKGLRNNPGWELDKWKFLPMVRRTLQEFPDKQWYIFIETDTYIFWSTLLAYLAFLDPTKRLYMGHQVLIGEDLFAHGGSGFVISRPAIEAAVAEYVEHKAEWEEFTSLHWAGDCVLGKALNDSGTPLVWAWPIWQGDEIGRMNFSEVDNRRRLWCFPAVSYHHLSPSVVSDMWLFEQDWISRHGADESLALRHSDVFAEYVLPRTKEPKSNWDNFADEDRGVVISLGECRAICERDNVCLQYAVQGDGKCMTTSHPELGEGAPGVRSGWINERMQRFHDEMEPCGDEGGWIM